MPLYFQRVLIKHPPACNPDWQESMWEPMLAEVRLHENICTADEAPALCLPSLNPSLHPGGLLGLPPPSTQLCLVFLFLALHCIWPQKPCGPFFTDSSHQPIRFPLPQTVTFIETSLQMRGLEIIQMSSPRCHSQGSQDLPWQVCWSQ